MYDEEQGLFLGVEFDTKGAQKAIKEIGKEIEYYTKEGQKIQQEIDRIEKDLERAAKIINDGTDGIREGEALIEVQQKQVAALTDRWAELKNRQTEYSDTVQTLTNKFEILQQKIADAGAIKNIDVQLKSIKNTVSEIQVDKMGLSGEDGALDALIAKYNKLSVEYEKQVNAVESLRRAIEYLKEEQQKYSEDGVVSEHIVQKLAEYNNKLVEQETKLESVQLKTESARQAVYDYTEQINRQSEAEQERIRLEQEQIRAEEERISFEKELKESVRSYIEAQREKHEAEKVSAEGEQEILSVTQQTTEELKQQAAEEERIAESATRAEAEFAQIKEDVRNIEIQEGFDFTKTNQTLEEAKGQLNELLEREKRITEEKERQQRIIENSQSAMQNPLYSEQKYQDMYSKRISEAESAMERLEAESQKVSAAIDEIRRKIYEMSGDPIGVDLQSFSDAKNEAKYLDELLKQVRGTASEISFPRLDLSVDDTKLQSLIDKYNQLAAQYDTQASKVSKLEAEQSKNGAVSAEVSAKLTEYSNKLAEAEAKLESLKHKTESARGAVTEYADELSRSQSVAGRVSDYIQSRVQRIGNAFERITTRLKNILFRFVVMRTLYAAFNSLKNIMSAMASENSSLQNSFNQLKSELLVAFYPVLKLLSNGLETLVGWLIKATQYVGAFIRGITGTSVEGAVEGAKKLYDALIAEETYKAEKKRIDEKIKEKQREIKALEKQAKAIKKEYDEEKKAIDRKKDALDDEIKAVNRTIDALRKQESAEKKAAKALKESIQDQIEALNARKKARQDEINQQRKALDAEIKAIDKEIKALQKQKEVREEELKQEERNLAGFDTLQILQGSEAENPEVQAIDNQIAALEEKKDVLQETKDEIPTGSDDPLIQQIEAEIDALNKQKDAIKEVDYSDLIQQQQNVIQSYQDQKENLNELLEKLQDKYDFKITGIDEAKNKIQEAINKLQEEKAEIEAARNEAAKPLKFNISLFDINEAKKQLDKFIDKWGVLVGVLGAAVVAIGFIVGAPALIAAGIATLVALIAYKWKDIKQWFSDLKERLSKWWKGVTEKLGKLGEKWDKKREEINDKINNFFMKRIPEIWRKFISSAKEKLKGAINWLLTSIETALNWIIDKMNLLHFDVPDWVPGIGGSTVGFEINHVIIPKLAKGAVLPGGKPFLAIMGDQPAGQTNIETPEKLLRQIVREELQNMNLQVDVTNHFDGNLSQFARIIQPYIEVATKKASAFS